MVGIRTKQQYVDVLTKALNSMGWYHASLTCSGCQLPYTVILPRYGKERGPVGGHPVHQVELCLER